MFLKWLAETVRQRLKGQFIQGWYSDVENSAKCINYRLFKTQFKFEEYLVKLPPSMWIPLCTFRTVNHALPIEIGRHQHVERHRRLCTQCELAVMLDEYHFISVYTTLVVQ